MKKLAMLVVLLGVNGLFAKNLIEDEIVLKNGNKTSIRSNSFKVDYGSKTVSYVSTANEFNKLKFTEFNSVVFGSNKFEAINLGGNVMTDAFFVLTETKSKKMLIKAVLKEEEDDVKYDLYITDLKNNVIESYVLNNKSDKASASVRSEIFAVVKFYFPECEMLLKRMELYDKFDHDKTNMKILSFFNNPVYYDYTK